jgi:plastocyanin
VRKFLRVLGAALIASSVACGGGGSAANVTNPGGAGTGGVGGGGQSGGPVTTTSVGVSDNMFTPNAIIVPVGATVTWTWAQGSVLHNVTFDGSTSGDRANGASYEKTFPTAGTFPYSCTIHPGMTGTVQVQ